MARNHCEHCHKDFDHRQVWGAGWEAASGPGGDSVVWVGREFCSVECHDAHAAAWHVPEPALTKENPVPDPVPIPTREELAREATRLLARDAEDFDRDAAHQLAAPALTMETFWTLRNQWSEATFGSRDDRGPQGSLKHLKKEVDEAIAAVDALHARSDPANPKPSPDEVAAARDAIHEEIADLLFLVFDVAHRCGMSYAQVRIAATKKLLKNRARKWGPASATDAVEHVRDGEGGV